MGLFNRREREREAGKKVASARLQVDLALEKMDDVLNTVHSQALLARKELRERSSDRPAPRRTS